jgi:CRP/FNR family cyclic AMP-dependent transcriptional regulator
LIARLSEPGEVLGLQSTVTGIPYEWTAEVVEPTQADFVYADDFLDFLREYGEVALRVAQQLGETYHMALAEMRTTGLAHSAEEKMARFVLNITANQKVEKGLVKATLTLTHEEIAQIIGTSRETVTRMLLLFRKKNLVVISGSTLTLKDRAGLKRLAEG